jgi:hypothetical protein
VSPETCCVIKKHWNNKFYYTVASCWFFLWDLCCDERIHEYQGHILGVRKSVCYHSAKMSNKIMYAVLVAENVRLHQRVWIISFNEMQWQLAGWRNETI